MGGISPGFQQVPSYLRRRLHAWQASRHMVALQHGTGTSTTSFPNQVNWWLWWLQYWLISYCNAIACYIEWPLGQPLGELAGGLSQLAGCLRLPETNTSYPCLSVRLLWYKLYQKLAGSSDSSHLSVYHLKGISHMVNAASWKYQGVTSI